MRVSAQCVSQRSRCACASSRLSKRSPLSGFFLACPTPDSTFPLRSGSWIRQGMENHQARTSAQSTKGFLMQLCPHTGTRTPDQQTYRLPAVAQGHHEQSRATVFPALRIAYHRTRPVIDLGLFSGCGLDNPYGLGLCETPKPLNKTLEGLGALGKAVIGN